MLIRLQGGAATFNERLDEFFNDPTLQFNFEGAYYKAYNEPDLQAPFLYDYSGKPWKTQAVTRILQLQVYNTTISGIPGNDDLGTMSAWYVLSALGIYQVDPSLPYFELPVPYSRKWCSTWNRPTRAPNSCSSHPTIPIPTSTSIRSN